MNKHLLEHDRCQFKRLVISHFDLSDAGGYADLIINRNLHGARGKEDRLLLRGLNLALIVSYWRPFSGNRESSDTKGRLKGYKEVLTEAEGRLHRRIGNLRNQDHAHSDPLAHSVKVAVLDLNGEALAMPIGRNTSVPIGRENTLQLRAMIEKLLDWISNELLKIQKRLPPDTTF
ncbi:MAG: hypothetical protein KAI66_17915 [Lentisphaeria bacterium]|nr:hypothetical protein [Lentisphaeria bacterium]